jgi:hypothetical protein
MYLRVREASGPVLATDGAGGREAYPGLVMYGTVFRVATGPGGRAVVELGETSYELGENSMLGFREGQSRAIVKPFVGRLWNKVMEMIHGPDYLAEQWLKEDAATSNAVAGVRG